MSISPVDVVFARVLSVAHPVPPTNLRRRVGYYSAVVRADEARAIGRHDRAEDLDAASENLRDHLPTIDGYRVGDVLRAAEVA